MKIFIFIVTAVHLAFSQVVPIERLHRHTSDGIAFAVGSQIQIQGIVTADFLDTDTLFCVQDETAGMTLVLAANVEKNIQTGDKLEIRGTLEQVEGMTRLRIKDAADIVLIESDRELPQSRIITCANLQNSFKADQAEPNESRLVQLSGIQIVNVDTNRATVRDFSGEATIAIKPDWELPTGIFDLVGIVFQEDSTLPYTAGYYLRPRTRSDLLQSTRVRLVQPPEEIAIEPTSVTLTWQTDVPVATIFRWGTDSMINQSTNDIPTDQHELSLQNLSSSTLYQGQALAISKADTVLSDTLLFATASDVSSGEINVYFTQSVDTTVAKYQNANGNVDLSKVLIEEIKKADFTIDFSTFTFTHHEIATELARAHLRGVQVRIIIDDDNVSSEIDYLRNTVGVPVITDDFGSNNGFGAMHSKFMVFDYGKDLSGSNDRVWMGSANATYNGSQHNAENMLLIHDTSLAMAFTLEFNEMWGSNTLVPDPQKSRMGARKRDNIPHKFNIGGKWVEMYASPSDNTENRIKQAIASAKQSVYFALLTFTSTGLENALEAVFHSEENIALSGLVDDSNINSDIYERMTGIGYEAWSPPADVLPAVFPGSPFFHHKYCLIDPGLFEGQPLVITGSHNWSNAANSINDETTLVIHDADIVNQFMQEFTERYRQAGGGNELLTHVETSAQESVTPVLKNFPNPFNQYTTLIYTDNVNTKLIITDILGRTVYEKDILSSRQPISIQWNGQDQNGRSLPSGLYFAFLSSHPIKTMTKLLLVR
jgi:phosphatidylserine/phosphatidylglycerophosphate/cardiolipin synthase-like enzyme